MRRSAPPVSPNPRHPGICGIATPAFVFISRVPVARPDYTRTPTAPRKSHMQIVARCFTVRGSNEPNLCGALLGRFAGTFVEFSGKPITYRRMGFMGIALAGTGTRRYTFICVICIRPDGPNFINLVDWTEWFRSYLFATDTTLLVCNWD